MAFALAILLPALMVAAVTTWQAADGYRTAFEAQLQDSAQALAMALDTRLVEDFALLEALATDPALDADTSPGDRDARLHRAAADLGRTLALVDPADGQYLVHTAVPPAASLPKTPLIGAVTRVLQTGRPVVTDLVDGPVMGRPIIGLAVPVVRGGRILFVLSMRLEPEAVLAQMLAQDLPRHAFAVLLDGQRRIIARTLDHEASLGRTAPAWHAATILQPRGAVAGHSLEGTRVLGAFARPQTAPGWTAVVLMPRADHVWTWTRPLAVLAAATVLLLLLSALMALYVARRLLRPVEALRQHARALVEGGKTGDAADTVSSVGEFEALRRDLVAARAVLQESEANLRLAQEAAGIGVFAHHMASGQAYLSPALYRVWGLAPPEAGGQLSEDAFLSLVLPEDLEEFLVRRAAWRADPTVTRYASEFRIRRADTGAVRWIEAVGEYVRDAAGQAILMRGINHDITERKQAEERLTLLAREVDHRAKNILAVVQATLRLTPKDDAASYTRKVEGRITSMARAHNLLARDGWRGADLGALVAGELKPFAGSIATSGEADGTDRMGPVVALDGPAVMLQAGLVQSLAMVMHELATNAVKYGALSVPEGRVSVFWRLPPDATGQLRLCWTETGGPAVRGEPDRTGFGTRVLQGSVRGQLGGTISLAWKPTGLVCELTVPFERSARPIEARAEAGVG